MPSHPAAAESSSFGTVIYAKRDGVAWVTLNRPDRFNAYNVAMRDDLYQVLSAVHEDPEVSAMVLAGAGPAFSTGGDVSEFGQAPSPLAARWIRFRRDVWGRLRSLSIPTIAAVHGFTVELDLEKGAVKVYGKNFRELVISRGEEGIIISKTALPVTFLPCTPGNERLSP